MVEGRERVGSEAQYRTEGGDGSANVDPEYSMGQDIPAENSNLPQIPGSKKRQSMAEAFDTNNSVYKQAQLEA